MALPLEQGRGEKGAANADDDADTSGSLAKLLMPAPDYHLPPVLPCHQFCALHATPYYFCLPSIPILPVTLRLLPPVPHSHGIYLLYRRLLHGCTTRCTTTKTRRWLARAAWRRRNAKARLRRALLTARRAHYLFIFYKTPACKRRWRLLPRAGIGPPAPLFWRHISSLLAAWQRAQHEINALCNMRAAALCVLARYQDLKQLPPTG